MKKLHDWGVKAIKVDFFQSDKQDIMKLYTDILKDAAKQEITVIFHGSTMPRGWARTYPNLLAMESVRGRRELWMVQRFCYGCRRVKYHLCIYP
jgi:alpha-glucosidase